MINAGWYEAWVAFGSKLRVQRRYPNAEQILYQEHCREKQTRRMK
jgi:hypothetical protein